MILSRVPLTVLFALAALALASLDRAEAQDVDLDCKLLICLPGGFPSGCGDARDHMIDRLRDGKSPIGFCDTGGGEGYEDYEIDYAFHRATSSAGWTCPEGSSLYHDTSYTDEGRTRRTVRTFCYEERQSVRMGDTRRYYYTGRSVPERTDMSLDMTIGPESEAPYETGLMRFDTGYVSDWRTRIYHVE